MIQTQNQRQQFQQYGAVDTEDAELQRVLAISANTGGPQDRNWEPIARVDQRIREKDQPTGLRNIGNTCYFNSLLQVYFTLPSFVTKILTFEVVNLDDSIEEAKVNNELKKKLVKSGMQLISELQNLFSTMALGKKKYLDPSGVLDSVLDDQGDKVAIGDEKDISEYNQILLTRIQDAFNWKNEIEGEGNKNSPQDSASI